MPAGETKKKTEKTTNKAVLLEEKKQTDFFIVHDLSITITYVYSNYLRKI